MDDVRGFRQIAKVIYQCNKSGSSAGTRIVIFAIAGLIAFSSWAQITTNLPPALRRPNIILIVADDLGYGDLGCYGQTKIKTPNLDKLASEGMRFTDFYSGSTVCAPSRASLMTGLHSGHGKIRGNRQNLALEAGEFTIAELLQQNRYRTCLSGKWGLGNPGSTGLPQKKGFDEFVGYLDHVHAHDYYTDHLFRYDPKTGFDGRIELPENRDRKKGVYIPDLFAKAAVNFVRLNKPEQLNGYRSFFLYFADILPHANNEEMARSGNGMDVPTDEPYSKETWPQVEKNKAAMITRLDYDIGQVLAQLSKLGLEETTVVMFTSDNGPHKEGGVDPKFFNSSGPLRGIKRDLYEGGIRVPLIVRWPGKIKPGMVSDRVSAFWDVLPTVADIAMLKAPEKIDGISFLPTLLGRPQTNQHDFLYWEFHERGFQQAARMGEWKAVRPQAGEPLELYDLKKDIDETNNVASRQHEVVAQFEKRFETARTESDRWPIKKPAEQNVKKKKAAKE